MFKIKYCFVPAVCENKNNEREMTRTAILWVIQSEKPPKTEQRVPVSLVSLAAFSVSPLAHWIFLCTLHNNASKCSFLYHLLILIHRHIHQFESFGSSSYTPPQSSSCSSSSPTQESIHSQRISLFGCILVEMSLYLEHNISSPAPVADWEWML